MEKAFYNVAGEAMKYERGYCTAQRFPRLLKTWEQKLQKVPPILQEAFTDTYDEELRRLWKTLRTAVPELRERVERIFHRLRIEEAQAPPCRVAHIFAQFIRGITYFFTEERHGVPTYHRLVLSGGGKKEAFRCYVENLIYDHIRRHHLGVKHDEGPEPPHPACFSGEPIDIHIQYDAMWPMELTLTRTTSHGNVRKETYKKTLVRHLNGTTYYEDVVEAQREEGNVLWFKAPRFAHPGRWTRVQPRSSSAPSKS